MKDIVYFYIGLTTLVLVTVTIMATMNFPFNWVFYTTVLGQALVIFMVYKVLRDKYTTTKTFEDFYEDHPIREQEHYR
jgi:TRAP-type C4-dicarboxylate transport system permease small subunit